MSGVSATYIDILAYVCRLSNVFNVQLAYYYGGHTQSTLVIRRVRCSYADIRWLLWTVVDIKVQNATHTLLIGSIQYQYGMYTPNTVFSRAFCVYEKYVMNFYTQLLHFSHTQQCDRAITVMQWFE